MISITERNLRVQEILDTFYTQACNPDIIVDETDYAASLDSLFSTTVWGFREILLVVIVATKLDNTYRASSELYICNPRALFEGPIKTFLTEKGIPHRKSGPLNIAKATLGLNANWASQRRPQQIANEVVNLINYLESDTHIIDSKATNMGISLLRRLLDSAHELEQLAVEIPYSEDPILLTKYCFSLIDNAPDFGNTPQKIIGFLLQSFHLSFHTGISITGIDDSASVTSTTSQKPGDLNEEYFGSILKVYEITVKPFDTARITDSYDCISIYNSSHIDNTVKEIIVLCRPNDCPDEMVNSGLTEYMGYSTYQDVIYYYINLYEWIASMLQHITGTGRNSFYNLLNTYINLPNTSEQVKNIWYNLHHN